MTAHEHTVRIERRRGFQPPWYRVLIYTCPDGAHAVTVRVNWSGGTPPGAIVGNCGRLVTL